MMRHVRFAALCLAVYEGVNELANERKSPPFEGGEAAPKAQTGVVYSGNPSS